MKNEICIASKEAIIVTSVRTGNREATRRREDSERQCHPREFSLYKMGQSVDHRGSTVRRHKHISTKERCISGRCTNIYQWYLRMGRTHTQIERTVFEVLWFCNTRKGTGRKCNTLPLHVRVDIWWYGRSFVEGPLDAYLQVSSYYCVLHIYNMGMLRTSAFQM